MNKSTSILNMCVAVYAMLLSPQVASVSAESYELTVAESALVKDGTYSRLLADAMATYTRLKSGEYKDTFVAAEKDAACLVVFPRVTTGALVAGATHGDGVATCKGSSGWSGISFVDLYGASLGAQVGGERTEAVVFMNDKNSASQLMEGKFTFAPTASAVAGQGRAMMKAGEPEGRVTIISNQKGLFAGVNLAGMYVQVDDDETRAFYREPFSTKTILTTYRYANPPGEIQKFYNVLP